MSCYFGNHQTVKYLFACSVTLSYYIDRVDQWYFMSNIPLKGILVITTYSKSNIKIQFFFCKYESTKHCILSFFNHLSILYTNFYSHTRITVVRISSTVPLENNFQNNLDLYHEIKSPQTSLSSANRDINLSCLKFGLYC